MLKPCVRHINMNNNFTFFQNKIYEKLSYKIQDPKNYFGFKWNIEMHCFWRSQSQKCTIGLIGWIYNYGTHQIRKKEDEVVNNFQDLSFLFSFFLFKETWCTFLLEHNRQLSLQVALDFYYRVQTINLLLKESSITSHQPTTLTTPHIF